jgi:lipopolysaccharide transport system permease protein
MGHNLWEHRDLVRQLLAQELQQRYRGSYLGILWPFITPLLMLAIYTFVFSIVFQLRWGGLSDRPAPPAQFALTLFAGLIPFSVFAEVANRSPTLVLGVPHYVKKVVFPLEVLPVVMLGSVLAHSLINVGILLAGTLLLQGQLSPTVAFLPIAYVPLVLLCLAVGWFLASLGVYVRDVGQGIGIVTQVLFFMSPVFYPVSAVPEELRIVLQVNPLTPILSGYRWAMLWDAPPDWGLWAGWTMITAVLATLAYQWFIRTKPGFADVL